MKETSKMTYIKYLLIGLAAIGLLLLGFWLGQAYDKEKGFVIPQITDRADKVFKTNDIGEVEMRLVGSELNWKYNYQSEDKWSVIEIQDPDTLTYVGLGLLKDSVQFYSTGYIQEAEGYARISDFDPNATTSILRTQASADYIVNDTNVYALVSEMSPPVLVQVPGADAASFKIHGNGYGVDTSHVYYYDKLVPDAVPLEATFRSTDQLTFLQTANTLYFKGVPLSGIQITKVQFLKDSSIVTDGLTYYYLKGNCHFVQYERGTAEDMATYQGVC